MVEVKARFPMVNDKFDEEEFIERLADWCGQYVDEIAIPVMVCAHELYEDAAVRHLVYEWWDEMKKHNAARRRYLNGFADYDPKCPPFKEGWHADKKNALNEALRTLLVR